MKLSPGLAAIAASLTVAGVNAAVPQWGQCGGMYYTGVRIDQGSSAGRPSLKPTRFIRKRHANHHTFASTQMTGVNSQCLAVTTTTTRSSTTRSSTTTTRSSTTTSRSTIRDSTTTKSSSTTSKSTTTTTTTTETPSPTIKKFKLFGVNEAVAEFGTAIPGILNK
ncbi:hypothetical protein FRC01_010951, partial [Tulasnella sp. 417]